jgi:hypothetical protein
MYNPFHFAPYGAMTPAFLSAPQAFSQIVYAQPLQPLPPPVAAPQPTVTAQAPPAAPAQPTFVTQIPQTSMLQTPQYPQGNGYQQQAPMN